ncbi:MAG: GAF domain-containing protein [Anaerolineales bacterium]|nr:GAF domain-containing protein [Anaerolineales bacterium]
MIARPRQQWGDKINLGILIGFQVLAVVVLISVPFLMENWLQGEPQFSASSRWLYFYIPYLLGLIFITSSIWVFSQRRTDAIGQIYSLFATATAISLFCLFDAYTTQRLLSIWVVSVALSGGALINLALIYPEQARVNYQHPTSRYVGYLPSAVLILLTFFIQYFSGYSFDFATILFLELIFITLALMFFFSSTLIRRFGSPSPMVREQARLILWGFGISFGPLIIWLLVSLFRAKVQISPPLFISMSAFPIFLTYAILRYRTLGTKTLLKRGIIYGTLLVFIAGSYALLVSGLSLLAGSRLENSHPLMVGMVVFLIALVVYPLRVSLQTRVDAAFFRGGEIYQTSLQNFGHELTRMTDFEGILHLLKDYIDGSLSPSRVYIYTIDESNNYYISAANADGTQGSDIHFARSGALVDLLTKQASTIFIGDNSKMPEDLLVDQARIAVLQAELFVPILGQSGMIGWLALGSRRSGEPYSTHNIHYLESLCDQASLALERSQVVSALERRIHEMDTITRVAEEINQKLALDDLLDMFYTETHSLVPTVDFRITLRSSPSEDFHHVFYISDNKRSIRRENQPILAKHSLETVVIQSQFPIVTVDYVGECRRRGISAESKEIHAWMSVPLNAGSETIGAVCVGSRDPAVIYTPEQVNLLQAVADLVAGAIVKTRLLDESQKQAHQMATLNELTRSLTSTLELNPLLNRIMESAVEILDCEAGSLLLIDEKTGESVFEVAIGPVGSDLRGRRLPAGVGLVGKAVQTKQAIIENDVRRSEHWFNADKNTGFSSKDLLVVPLVVKDHVIGVLEVLNKKDESPFNHKDLELLTAFAGQMAVAIENARLYTQTDQALAARVDELSIMQRIDQELNASLDFMHVMSITLEASMRHSRASAGLIGSLENGGLRVIAAQGFPSETMEVGGVLKADQLPGLEEALNVENAQPVMTSITKSELTDDRDDASKSGQDGSQLLSLMPDTSGQILIPIQRESEVIGIIFLASTETSGFTDENVEFLSRLSDHAAIAISNAQLYAEVQAANKAKSEFVSAAAHELKNPLTSIKGYSDLLVGGSVGPVSEGQASFLATIRSNAERMRTLVSDLQDITRIEAGQLQLQFASESLEGITQEVVTSLDTQIDEKGQQLVIRVAEDLPLVWCDVNRMVQVLTNLVSNANKYTPNGGQIEILASQIDAPKESEDRKQMVRVSIVDNGFGISPDDQKKIFEQFFRSEDSQVRETTGTGLGLSITKKLVEMQGGELWFESELGQGTTFHFTIPITDHN